MSGFYRLPPVIHPDRRQRDERKKFKEELLDEIERIIRNTVMDVLSNERNGYGNKGSKK
jgi:hypothetical protein